MTFILILNYLDPYEYKIIAIFSIIFTFILSVASFFTIILYFFKKIYFRGRVYVYHVLSSFRQWFFVSIFIISIIFFKTLWVPLVITWFLILSILMLLEFVIKNLENK